MSDEDLREFLPEQLTEFFEYLDALRKSGVTNMYGASPYLAGEFTLGRNEARTVLQAWMQTFSEEPATARVKAALSKAKAQP